MTATLVKLAFAGIRSRLLASALTVLLASAAAATIVLALEVGETIRAPWQRTFTAANGAHVLAMVASESDARAIAALPGSAERDEPVPGAFASVTDGGSDRLQLAGLGAAPRVNAPVPTQGAGPRDGGIVLERSFAAALGLRVGAPIKLAAGGGTVALRVAGTAVSPAQPRYPRRNPGLAWVTHATLERIEPDRSRWHWTQAVRLADPAARPAFAARAAAVPPPGTASIETWQDQRANALRDATPLSIILTTYTIVLLAVVFAVVAILVSARASAQHREIGLLKAVGVTPRQITAVFAIESATLGALAVIIGFSAGALLAPRLAGASAETMLGAPTTAPSGWHLLAAACPVLVVLIASVRASTRRSTRFRRGHRRPRDRAVVVARSRPARDRAPDRRGHEPPGQAGGAAPGGRRAPLRVRTAAGPSLGPPWVRVATA